MAGLVEVARGADLINALVRTCFLSRNKKLIALGFDGSRICFEKYMYFECCSWTVKTFM